MRKYSFSVILAGAFFALSAPCLANEAVTEELDHFESSAYEKMNGMKTSITTLLKENKQLELQYVTLLEEYNRLQEELSIFAGEISDLTKEYVKKKDLEKEKEHSVQRLQKDLNSLNDELLLKKSRNAYLNARLLDTDAKTKILQLKLQDLQFAQRELELVAKQKEFALSEKKRKSEGEIAQLREQIQYNIEKTEGILKHVQQIEEESLSYEKTIQSLDMENKDLENQLSEKEKQHQFNDQELSLLKNKKLYLTRKAEHLMFQKEQERNELKAVVDELGQQLAEIKAKVNISFSRQGTKREIVDSLLNIDKENQELKERIQNIQSKIKELD